MTFDVQNIIEHYLYHFTIGAEIHEAFVFSFLPPHWEPPALKHAALFSGNALLTAFKKRSEANGFHQVVNHIQFITFQRIFREKSSSEI